MRCTRHKPTGAGGCQKGLVTQASCRRKAKYVRQLKTGKQVHLCAKCDGDFGVTLGTSCRTYVAIHTNGTGDCKRADHFEKFHAPDDSDALVRALSIMRSNSFEFIHLSREQEKCLSKRIATLWAF